jgi:hypothetical protein
MRNFFNTNKHWTKIAEDTANMSEEELDEHRDHLETCSYGYVLCSCGSCHCENCNHTCSYETGYRREGDMRS